MANPTTAAPGSSEDIRVLVEILKTIESQLEKLVLHSPRKFRKEFAKLLPGPWKEVTRRFELARQQIAGTNVDWAYIEGVGLTSTSAKWKQDVLDAAVKTGVWSRILKVCNAILGSLSGAIPAVEFIKEYKDCVEACLRVIRGPND